MKLSKNWLKDYVDIENHDLFHTLSLHTSEVEEEIKIGHLPNIVVGHVKEVTQHPNADKLRVAQVDTGENSLRTIVCGAPNLEVGQKVAAALPGAVMPAGFTITVSPLRGVESQGMLCSEDEMGLTAERQPGIMVLPGDAPVGIPIEEYLDTKDTVLDIENKSITNRPDLFGHYGIARECSALFDLPLKPYNSHSVDWESTLSPLQITIEDTDACKRYVGVRIENLVPKASPDWLQKRLKAIGHTPRNSIVDVTNYIMYDLGLPLHAFDGEKVGEEIIVGFQNVKEQELETLDDKKRSVSDAVLLIKDNHKPLALAGIMGLKESAISDNTTSILLEAACFNGATIRKGELVLSLRTEASIRYEKYLDPELCMSAIEKAISLLLEIHPGARLASAVTDIYPAPAAAVTVKTSFDFLRSRIGNDFSDEKIITTLEKLGFVLTGGNEALQIHVPSWRATGDISIPEDIVEELVRMHGYDNIVPTAPLMPLRPAHKQKEYDLKERLTTLLAGEYHLHETLSYSFYSKELHALFGLEKLPEHEAIVVQNPLSAEQEIMRTSLAPQMARHAAKESSMSDTYGIFEIEKVYRKSGGAVMDEKRGKSKEPVHIGIAVAKDVQETNQQTLYDSHPFYHVKHIVEDIAAHHGATVRFELSSSPLSYLHPLRSTEVYLNNMYWGYVGELHPKVAHALDSTKTIVISELNIDTLLQNMSEPAFKAYSLFPTVQRDISILVEKKQQVGDILSFVKNFHTHISAVALTDIFEGQSIESGKKSVTLSLTLEDTTKTMTDEEVLTIMNTLFEALKKEFDLEIRGV